MCVCVGGDLDFLFVCVCVGGDKEGDRRSDRIKVSKYSLYTILYKI